MLCEDIYQELLVKIKERPIILYSQFGNGITESKGVLIYFTVRLHMYCMEETKSAVYVGVCVIIHLYEPVMWTKSCATQNQGWVMVDITKID